MNKTKKKMILALVMIAVVMTAAIGGTVAYLIARTDAVVNTFEPASVPVEIVETFKNNVKSDIKIKNSADSDTSVYVRVNLLRYWSDAPGGQNGNPVGKSEWSWTEPELGDGWFKDGGYYYYTDPIEPGDETNALFSGPITLKSETVGEDTFYQTLDILAQAVQATPADAVEAAWTAVEVTNGQLTQKSGN